MLQTTEELCRNHRSLVPSKKLKPEMASGKQQQEQAPRGLREYGKPLTGRLGPARTCWAGFPYAPARLASSSVATHVPPYTWDSEVDPRSSWKCQQQAFGCRRHSP